MARRAIVMVFPKISPAKYIEYYPIAVVSVAQQGLQTCLQHFEVLPNMLAIPYDANQVKVLCATIDDWAIFRCSFPGHIDCHYLKHPLLPSLRNTLLYFPKSLHHNPFQEQVLFLWTDQKWAVVFI